MKNSEEFMELMRVMASCIGSPCNPSKLENTFKSVKNETLDRKTISKLRNALLNFRQVEENHIMENVIYNELRLRGFCVDVGMVEARTAKERKQLEVDFVANMADRRYYIQSAFAMPDDAKREQECASLKRIDDSFKKIIIMRDDIKPYHDNNGFYIVGLMDFLLKPDLMEQL